MAPALPVIIANKQATEIFEGRLLEKARLALRAGQSAAALNSLAEAEKVRGDPLAEEREALTVMALARSGNISEAERRMSIFTVRYPQSIYLNRLHTEVTPHDADAE